MESARDQDTATLYSFNKQVRRLLLEYLDGPSACALLKTCRMWAYDTLDTVLERQALKWKDCDTPITVQVSKGPLPLVLVRCRRCDRLAPALDNTFLSVVEYRPDCMMHQQNAHMRMPFRFADSSSTSYPSGDVLHLAETHFCSMNCVSNQPENHNQMVTCGNCEKSGELKLIMPWLILKKNGEPLVTYPPICTICPHHMPSKTKYYHGCLECTDYRCDECAPFEKSRRARRTKLMQASPFAFRAPNPEDATPQDQYQYESGNECCIN